MKICRNMSNTGGWGYGLGVRVGGWGLGFLIDTKSHHLLVLFQSSYMFHDFSSFSFQYIFKCQNLVLMAGAWALESSV